MVPGYVDREQGSLMKGTLAQLVRTVKGRLVQASPVVHVWTPISRSTFCGIVYGLYTWEGDTAHVEDPKRLCRKCCPKGI